MSGCFRSEKSVTSSSLLSLGTSKQSFNTGTVGASIDKQPRAGCVKIMQHAAQPSKPDTPPPNHETSQSRGITNINHVPANLRRKPLSEENRLTFTLAAISAAARR